MARLQSLRPQVATLPSRVQSTASLGESYGQGRGGRPWRRLREQVLKRDGHLCQSCRSKGELVLANEVDHIVPLAEGGTDSEANLQAICRSCHDAKTKAEAARGAARRYR